MGSIANSNATYCGKQMPAELMAPFARRQFGKDVAREFLFDPEYRNLNHGSYGTIPRAIQTLRHYYQDQAEVRPDQFIRYDRIEVQDESRAAVAPLLGVDKDTVVFVNNATTAFNEVLRNIVWADDGADEILDFNITYGACENTIKFVVGLSRGLASSRCVQLDYPLTDDEVLGRFRDAVKQSRAEGKRPRVAVMDVVTSSPGVRFPFEKLVAVCHDEGILSLVDGAQGIGMVDLTHVGAVGPDFFLSNCHKWLFVPRGCAVLHVPARNHAMMRSTLPTSWSFDPDGGPVDFVASHNNIAAQDHSASMCVRDSIRWRREVLGGEEAIVSYITKLAQEGGRRAAEILGTQVFENSEGTLTGCAMVNVGLPVGVAGGGAATIPPPRIVVPAEEAAKLSDWMQQTLLRDYKTFIPLTLYNGRWWARISAQVYLELEDFEWAAKTLLELSERVARGDHKDHAASQSGLDAHIHQLNISRGARKE